MIDQPRNNRDHFQCKCSDPVHVLSSNIHHDRSSIDDCFFWFCFTYFLYSASASFQKLHSNVSKVCILLFHYQICSPSNGICHLGSYSRLLHSPSILSPSWPSMNHIINKSLPWEFAFWLIDSIQAGPSVTPRYRCSLSIKVSQLCRWPLNLTQYPWLKFDSNWGSYTYSILSSGMKYLLSTIHTIIPFWKQLTLLHSSLMMLSTA